MRRILLLSAAVGFSLAAAGCGSAESTQACNGQPASTVCENGVQFQADSCGRQVGAETPCACGCASSGDVCADCPCTPECAGRECGPDPACGESCGTCADAEKCQDGACVPSCTKDCEGRVCGPDPRCGESCGSCDAGFECDNGDCVGVCTPDCDGRECGPDPVCGRSCGTCGAGATCENGACVSHCTPDCAGRNCGVDPVCGESCGACGEAQACNPAGRCEPATGWKKTWGDEFDGASVPGDPCYDNVQTPPMCLDRYWSRAPCPADVLANLSELDKCTWSVYDIYNWMDWGKPWGTGMNNLDPHEVQVANGELLLTAHLAPQGGQPWDCGRDLADYYVSDHCPVRAGAIMSKAWSDALVTAGFQQLYGRFEVRAILPAGPGAWPAHWLLPQDGGWPEAGEIDIMEATWNDPNRAAGNFHGGTFDGDIRTHYSPGDFGHDPSDSRFTDSWHVYAAEWEPDEIRFYLDDLELGRVRAGDPAEATIIGANDPTKVGQSAGTLPLEIPATAFFWILNTSVVPNGGLQQDLSTFVPLTHRIDYVRVFEQCPAGEPGCTLAGSTSRIVTRSPDMSKAAWSAQNHDTFVGDFDGDLRADLLLQSRDDGTPTLLLLADTEGGFRPARVVDSLYGMLDFRWIADFRTVVVGDYDADGADDLLLRAVGAADDTFLLLADGQGGFRDYVDVTDAFGMTEPWWAAVDSQAFAADFDGDGDDDVLLQAKTAAGTTRLLRGDGQGGFLAAEDVTNSPGLNASHWDHANHKLFVGDFDGNGAADVLLQARDSIRPTMLALADGAGGWQLARDITDIPWMTAAKWSDQFRALAVGDFDGDGNDDIVMQSRGAGHASYLLRADGAGSFEAEQDITGSFGMTQSMWSAESRSMIVGDYDADGRDDVLLANRAAGARSYLLSGTSAGGFELVVDATDRGVMSEELWGTHDGYPGDYDGDGRLDVLLQARDEQHDTYVVRVDPQ